MDPYASVPLPQPESFRLLRLEPADDGKLINCFLNAYEDYRTGPPYQCISYCWGNPQDSIEIQCNNKPFRITKNLHAALRQFRRTGERGYLWADAICINQKDVEERNKQVAIMHKIFIRSSRVLVWLGPATEQTPLAMAMMRKISHRIHQRYYAAEAFDTWLPAVAFRKDLYHMIQKEEFLGDEECTSDEWYVLWHFYSAKWFTRIWVIREVVQQTNVLVFCGDSYIKWDLVGLCGLWMVCKLHHFRGRFLQLKQSYGIFGADFMWSRPSQMSVSVPLLHLLDKTRGFGSSDARDKVYALLHLEETYNFTTGIKRSEHGRANDLIAVSTVSLCGRFLARARSRAFVILTSQSDAPRS